MEFDFFSHYYHPIFVHFPIAFYFLEALLLALWGIRKKYLYFRLSVSSLKLGYLFMIFTMISGIIDAGGFEMLLEDALRNHFLTSVVAFIIYSIRFFSLKYVLASKERFKKRHVTGAIVGYLVLIVTSYLGGQLVYS